MNFKKSVITAVLLSGSASLALAAGNPLSVHVLNTQNGLPSPDVTVVLERQTDDGWVKLNEAVTDEKGRIGELYPAGKSLENGTYRVVFETGEWYKKQDMKSFFPEIPVVFTMDGTLEHYHVPLLLSPYAYSTYRGN